MDFENDVRVSCSMAPAKRSRTTCNHVTDLFGLDAVTLYDLTTYFEGVAAAQPLAQHGHSKEKRSDCPLLTLGLVVDGSGFVRRSEVLAGNIVEGEVLSALRLEVPAIAAAPTDESQVAAPGGASEFDGAAAVSLQTAPATGTGAGGVAAEVRIAARTSKSGFAVRPRTHKTDPHGR